MTRLSEAEHIALLRFIQGYFKVHSLPPSFREIRDHLGLSSLSPTGRRLDILIERGWLERKPHIARGIRVTNTGRKAMKDYNEELEAAVAAFKGE